jgi:uncharacterized membrane protein SpoIIM required for sporulation
LIRINNVRILIPLVLFIGILVGAGYEYYSSGNFQVEMMKEVNINQLMALSSIILKNTAAFLLLGLTLIVGKWFIILFFLINGFNIGMFSVHLSIIEFIVLFLPHGIFEYVVFYSESKVFIIDLDGSPSKAWLFKRLGFIYLGLVLAALVEVFITPLIVQYVI